jgi:SAM-dependent MidA family methyltransferase
MALSNAAYYASRDPLGRSGDFITAPEISQVFGELIGLWIADCWQQMGSPGDFSLIELGPGRGTLMADIFRVFRLCPGISAAIDLHLVESSPILRALQAQRFPAATFHDSIENFPAKPSILIANEFFDCLPVRQFVKMADGLHEYFVVTDPSGNLTLAPSPHVTDSRGLISSSPSETAEGTIFEVSMTALALVQDIAGHLGRHSGAALIIDYGRAAPSGATIQAVKAHRPVDLLSQPGAADLTAHVDFAGLRDAALRADVHVHGPIGQGAFLNRLGIATRRDSLIHAHPERAAEITAACDRLTAPTEMGELFRAMAICDSSFPPLVGFA